MVEIPTRRELALERSAARRVARKEIGELTRLMKHAGEDLGKFKQAAEAFYRGDYSAWVTDAMCCESSSYIAGVLALLGECSSATDFIEQRGLQAEAQLIASREASTQAIRQRLERLARAEAEPRPTVGTRR